MACQQCKTFARVIGNYITKVQEIEGDYATDEERNERAAIEFNNLFDWFYGTRNTQPGDFLPCHLVVKSEIKEEYQEF